MKIKASMRFDDGIVDLEEFDYEPPMTREQMIDEAVRMHLMVWMDIYRHDRKPLSAIARQVLEQWPSQSGYFCRYVREKYYHLAGGRPPKDLRTRIREKRAEIRLRTVGGAGEA